MEKCIWDVVEVMVTELPVAENKHRPEIDKSEGPRGCRFISSLKVNDVLCFEIHDDQINMSYVWFL